MNGAMEMLKVQEKEQAKKPAGTVVSDLKLADIEQLFKGLNSQIERVSNEQIKRIDQLEKRVLDVQDHMKKLSKKVDIKFTNQNVTRQNNDQFLGFY